MVSKRRLYLIVIIGLDGIYAFILLDFLCTRKLMCGIAGIISASPSTRDRIHSMTHALVHRGPDDEGYYTSPDIALGHRRLSIIDIDGGQQPISNETGSLQLICNGEIYNSPELRRQLIAAGHVFKTATDVEVILHLYEDHGSECVKHLRGMFAFAIWDSSNRQLFLARDHMGQKPLFYCQRDAEFLFASEPKALLASGQIRAQIDLEALWHYISLRYMPDDYTLFQNIKKLPAATTLIWNEGKVCLRKYWMLDFRSKNTGSESKIVDELDALLVETVKMHTLSDVRVGAFLSGGIDSSTVAAIMAGQTDSPIPAFSIGVEEQDFNELPYARMVAQKYGMETYDRVVQADLIHLIPSMIHHMDEPADPFGVGVYLVSQIASRVVKVVLSGDGGDESFAGYDRFVGQRIADYYANLPRWFRSHVVRRAAGLIPESFGYKSLAQKATWINDMSFYSSGERYAHSMCFLRFMPAAKEQLFTKQVRPEICDDDSIGKILRYFNAENAEHPIDRMLYTDLMTRMPDHLLTIADRMSMAHSLESRPTLVDHKIVEYAASIPAQMKLRRMKLKYMLKRVASKYLPAELMTRRKQGFAFPIGKWLRTDLCAFMSNLFLQSRFVDSGLFESAYINRLLREHIEGKVDHSYRLWILINLEFWYRMYIEQESVDSMRELTDRLIAR